MHDEVVKRRKWIGSVDGGHLFPSFVFVALVHPLIPHLRGSPWSSAFLDGVNVAAIGLMAVVTWQLGRAATVDPLTAALGLISLVALLRFKLNSVWLVLGGALVGAIAGLLTMLAPGIL